MRIFEQTRSIVVSAILVLPAVWGANVSYGDEKMAVIDFSDSPTPWVSIDDRVMGGVSSSEMVIEDGIGVFRGRVSEENNGGFASVRSLPGNYDLSAFDGVVVKVRGDGKQYAFRIRTTANFDGVSYQVRIRPEAGVWQELFLPFDQFEPVFRGRKVEGHPPIDRSNIRTFGFLIADRQEGQFQIELISISGVMESGS